MFSLSDFQHDGFARIPIRSPKEKDCIDRILHHIGTFTSFRFPPLEKSVQYTDDIREIFRISFGLGIDVLQFLVQHFHDTEAVVRLKKKIASLDMEKLFFHPDEPFVEGGVFSGSFFNLFHYDYGCLNTHKDRYLVTVIFAQPPKSIHENSVLWVQSPQTKQWQNLDAIEEPTWIIFIGEELERMSSQAGIPLLAAQHCIRVNPIGEYISHSHHQPDPESLAKGNRRSIALVVGEHHG